MRSQLNRISLLGVVRRKRKVLNLSDKKLVYLSIILVRFANDLEMIA